MYNSVITGSGCTKITGIAYIAERGRHVSYINVREIPWLVILMIFTLLFHYELWNVKYVI